MRRGIDAGIYEEGHAVIADPARERIRNRSCLMKTIMIVAAVLTVSRTTSSSGQEDVNRPFLHRSRGWTFDSAQQQLEKYPRDLFLQYVVLKLAQREGFAADGIPGLRARTRLDIAADRREDLDLFNLFSGSLAVQESLQLDAMQPGSNFSAGQNSKDAGSPVTVASLVGPNVASHPWQQMLAGRQPVTSPMATFIPADQYYIRFRSASRLLDVLEGGNLFARHLWSQAGEQSFQRATEDRLRQQLAIETNPLARPFYDLVVSELVITGSDPFVNEGSDVTLLLRYEQEFVFRARMDSFLNTAEAAAAGATRSEGTFEGIPFIHVTAPGRAVHVFSAYPSEGLHVRSNSQIAFERVLRLVAGKSSGGNPGPALTSLGETEEFQYIRTLMPFGSPEEDGLIYLSDPFIRRLVGPELKLTELRRLKCLNNLRMISYAAALFEAENGLVADSLDELRTSDCLPDGFETGDLRCRCGGTYALSPDGHQGFCSHHGSADALRPCCEIPETEVTAEEADAYRQFVEEYSQYWRTWFDPIAIRVLATPQMYRLETIVLPLINNSLYQSLATALGGEPRVLSGSITPEVTLSLHFALARERLLSLTGWKPPAEEPARAEGVNAEGGHAAASAAAQAESVDNLRMIGLALHNFHEIHQGFPSAVGADAEGQPRLSWRVHLLPLLDEGELYSRFRLDEAWNSPHNMALIDQIPRVYRSPGARLERGMTTYLTVRGKDTVFPGAAQIRIPEITDGTSQTGMAFDCAAWDAVIWTKPDDFESDATKLRASLRGRFGNGGLLLLADGSVIQLRMDLSEKTLTDLFSRNDGNPTVDFAVPGDRGPSRNDPLGLRSVMGGRLLERDVYVLLTQGLGDVIGLHVCDTDPSFDIQLTELFTDLPGSRIGAMPFGGQELWMGMAAASLTSPVYVSLAVNDADVVDWFLRKLDVGAAIETQRHTDMGWFAFRKDFYKVLVGTSEVRSFVLSLGPIRWRFFFTRVGDEVIIASRLQTLEQLIRRHEGSRSSESDEVVTTSSMKAHARLTIHRNQWNRIMPTMRLSWDEAARKSCLENIGPLISAAKVEAGALTGNSTNQAIAARAVAIYGGVHVCPCGGRYRGILGGGTECTVHGNLDEPRQPSPGDVNGASLAMLNSFSEIRVLLSFLEDGLRAVLEVDRTAGAAAGALPANQPSAR